MLCKTLAVVKIVCGVGIHSEIVDKKVLQNAKLRLPQKIKKKTSYTAQKMYFLKKIMC